MSTPGHTQGHYVFADQPLRDFLASLAKVRALPDLTLLPAHGPVTGSSHARVDELVAHHDERSSLCLKSVKAGAETAYAVAQDLPWTRHERTMMELDVFNATLATLETFAHVELLAAQGRIVRHESGGEVRYAPAGGS